MGYEKQNWVDHIEDSETGEIFQEGTLFTAKRMNHIEKGIYDISYEKEGKSKLTILTPKLKGTGDCILLITNNGKTILVDTGSAQDANTITEFLSSNSITKLDYIIITHYHSDHIGNLQLILDSVDISNCLAILPAEPAFGSFNGNGAKFAAETAKVYQKFKDKNITTKKPTENEVLIIDDIQLKFMNCSSDKFNNYYNETSEYANDGSTSYNNFSLVAEITHNNNKILLTGDIEAKAQEMLIDSVTKCDLLKCPHHSVNTQDYIPFLEKTKPTIAFSLNYGTTNLSSTYITRYMLSHGIPYYVTAKSGPLKFISDGFKIQCFNQTYTADFPNQQSLFKQFGVPNYMYFGLASIMSNYDAEGTTLVEVIKAMNEGSVALVNFTSSHSCTPDFISSYSGTGFICKSSAAKATILLYDNKPTTFNCYIGLWHSSIEEVKWYKLGHDDDIQQIKNKVGLTTYSTYNDMSSLGITANSTCIQMIKAMPPSSRYSGYVVQAFDSKLTEAGGIADIIKSSNDEFAKITLTSLASTGAETWIGTYNINRDPNIIWNLVTSTKL